jgi:hypothetical protein
MDFFEDVFIPEHAVQVSPVHSLSLRAQLVVLAPSPCVSTKHTA